MVDFFDSIVELLHRNDRSKLNYKNELAKAESTLINELLTMNYTYAPPAGWELINTDERLATMKEKVEYFKRNPKVGIAEFIMHCTEIMREFLTMTHLGNIRDLFFEGDLIHVTISCLLKHRDGDNKASNIKIFKDQMADLAQMGLVIDQKTKTGVHQFKDIDENRKIIKDILFVRGARLIKIESRGDHIIGVSFMIRPEDVYLFETLQHRDKIAVDDEILNDDEFEKINRSVVEIRSSLALAKSECSIKNACCQVAEYHFADICKIVGLMCETVNNVNARHEHSKDVNEKIRELEQSIGRTFVSNNASAAMENIRNNLMRFCVENLHSVVKNMKIDMYGNFTCTIDWVSDSNDFEYYTDDEMEPYGSPNYKVVERFNTYKDCYDRTYMLDESVNRELIEEMIAKIPGMQIGNIRVTKNDCADGKYVIFGMDAEINNVASILNLYII